MVQGCWFRAWAFRLWRFSFRPACQNVAVFPKSGPTGGLLQYGLSYCGGINGVKRFADTRYGLNIRLKALLSFEFFRF